MVVWASGKSRVIVSCHHLILYLFISDLLCTIATEVCGDVLVSITQMKNLSIYVSTGVLLRRLELLLPSVKHLPCSRKGV